MPQQIGVLASGTKASWLEIMCNTSGMSVVPVVIKGGVAVTLQPGTALRDCINPSIVNVVTPYTNGNLALTVADGVIDVGTPSILTSATGNFLNKGVMVGDTVALTGGGGGTKTITSVTATTIGLNTAGIAATGITIVLTRVTSVGLGLQAILLDEVVITVDDVQVTANAVLAGDIRSSKVIDSAGAALESTAKAFLSKGLLLL